MCSGKVEPSHPNRSRPSSRKECTLETDLFAGIPVNDLAAATPWYESLFGGPPAFLPNDTEAVWEVGPHQYV